VDEQWVTDIGSFVRSGAEFRLLRPVVARAERKTGVCYPATLVTTADHMIASFEPFFKSRQPSAATGRPRLFSSAWRRRVARLTARPDKRMAELAISGVCSRPRWACPRGPG